MAPATIDIRVRHQCIPTPVKTKACDGWFPREAPRDQVGAARDHRPHCGWPPRILTMENWDHPESHLTISVRSHRLQDLVVLAELKAFARPGDTVVVAAIDDLAGSMPQLRNIVRDHRPGGDVNSSGRSRDLRRWHLRRHRAPAALQRARRLRVTPGKTTTAQGLRAAKTRGVLPVDAACSTTNKQPN